MKKCQTANNTNGEVNLTISPLHYFLTSSNLTKALKGNNSIKDIIDKSINAVCKDYDKYRKSCKIDMQEQARLALIKLLLTIHDIKR